MDPTQPRHFLQIADHSPQTLRAMLDEAVRLKSIRRVAPEKPLAGKVLALVFEQPSTRTRVSFDVGMRELGGETIMLSGNEMQIGRGESIADTARVMSRFVDAIMIRMLSHADVSELAEYATIPIINGLTQRAHPTQIMADIQTIEEHRGRLNGKIIAYSGDGNNMLASWIEAATKFPFQLRMACPTELSLDNALIEDARTKGADLVVTTDPEEAVVGADVVMTDTFVSMGDDDAERRHNLLMPYQVNDRLMSRAGENAIFLHCLPAHRNEEVTDSVMDGPQSVVFDQAENRLHAHKGILVWALDAL
uniref:ornithine carbamoyltransferase n=1 Tax=Pararhizobium sp. IMCC3301 TaxID=3067904 RepID=UPI00274284BB|nr:ornithine carbamoyltransferase [Pararhizobium sp. IMCC3301]